MNTPKTITAAERAARKEGKPWTGLGDVVASATTALGIKPCPACKKRQADWNRAVPFASAATIKPDSPT